jgi:phosphoglycerate dehydrogenase-like enzyme
MSTRFLLFIVIIIQTLFSQSYNFKIDGKMLMQFLAIFIDIYRKYSINFALKPELTKSKYNTNMKIVEIEPIFTNQKARDNFSALIGEHDFIAYTTRPADDTEFMARASDADAIIVSNIPVSKAILDGCDKLKMISVAFTGIDHIDIEECRKRGILICNAAGYSTQSVAELTLGLILDLLRKITELDSNTRSLKSRNGFAGLELAHKDIGIIGAGAIGSQVGKILHLLGCNIYFTSRTQKPDTDWGTYLSFDQLLEKSDIITLHVPLTKDTENLINSSTITKMKDGVYIVNTARGKIIDYKALAEALTNGKIAGAAIDVYETEPPIDSNHPLLTAPHCVLTPHIAYATKEALNKRAEIASNNILEWIKR